MRELRWSGGDRGWPGVHRGDELRRQVPRVRQDNGRAAVGDDTPGGGQRDACDLHGEREGIRGDCDERWEGEGARARAVRRIRAGRALSVTPVPSQLDASGGGLEPLRFRSQGGYPALVASADDDQRLPVEEP